MPKAGKALVKVVIYIGNILQLSGVGFLGKGVEHLVQNEHAAHADRQRSTACRSEGIRPIACDLAADIADEVQHFAFVRTASDRVVNRNLHQARAGCHITNSGKQRLVCTGNLRGKPIRHIAEGRDVDETGAENVGDQGVALALVLNIEYAVIGEMISVDDQLVCCCIDLKQNIFPLTCCFVFILCADTAGGILPFLTVISGIWNPDGNIITQLMQLTQSKIISLNLISFLFVFLHRLLGDSQLRFAVQDIVTDFHSNSVACGNGGCLWRKR